MIIGRSGSGTTKVLINLKNEQENFDKIYLYSEDLSEPKYEFLIKKRKNAVTKYLNDPKKITECSGMMNDVYGNIDDYNPSRKRNILIVFDDMIADIMSQKNFKS